MCARCEVLEAALVRIMAHASVPQDAGNPAAARWRLDEIGDIASVALGGGALGDIERAAWGLPPKERTP